MSVSKLYPSFSPPSGYEFIEPYNILVPILSGTELHSGDSPENPDFATFQAETQSALLPDGAMPDRPKERLRKVRDETIEAVVGLPLSRFDQDADWVKEAQRKAVEAGTVRRVWYRVREWSDGFERTQIIGIENPGGVYVYKYRDDLYKVVVMVEPPDFGDRVKGTGNAEKPDDERWSSNLARARTAIEELALCNDWDYFATLTIDSDKLSRSDLEIFRKKLQQMIRNLRRHDGVEIDYLFVPELHPVALKDGRTEWHLHGLVRIPERYLVPFENRRKYGKDGNKFPPRYIREKILKKEPVFCWKQYGASFGYSVFEPVKNRDASARYLLKYVSKAQGKTAQHLEKGQNLYYHSTGLKRAQKEALELWETVKRNAKGGFRKTCENCLVFWYEM